MEREVAEIDTSGMEFLYEPRSIAIVGVSRNPDKPGGRPLAALQSRGYAGKVFPINPRHQELAGLECHPTILDVPDDVDMAIISVATEAVLEVARQFAHKSVYHRDAIEELDINPLVVFPRGAKAVDALIKTKPRGSDEEE